jgi:hypothetical protein
VSRLIGAQAVILPTAQFQRVTIAALLSLPLLLIVALSAPAWIVLPFLSTGRRTAVIKFLGCLILWVKAIAG